VSGGFGVGCGGVLNDFGQGTDLGQDPVGAVQVPAEAEALWGEARSEPAVPPSPCPPSHPHHLAAGPRCTPRLRDPEPLPGGPRRVPLPPRFKAGVAPKLPGEGALPGLGVAGMLRDAASRVRLRGRPASGRCRARSGRKASEPAAPARPRLKLPSVCPSAER